MARKLDGLIAHLLLIVSCAGHQGCSVGELLSAIQDVAESQTDPILYDDLCITRAASVIWSWLRQRDDISIGRERRYNGLTLHELRIQLRRCSRSHDLLEKNRRGPSVAVLTFQNPPEQAATEDIRIYAADATMWEMIAGHSIDFKRLPRSEWLLLQCIASRISEGILQGDLGREAGQDKRSVPKRTEALLRKGYILKRTTLVRGTKTSKMWLKCFAPSISQEKDAGAKHNGIMNIANQSLAIDLDPVPWHSRWTGTDVDYSTLVATMMAIIKEWDVIRLSDLKQKLGIFGMRWQMKIVSKTCRFLHSRRTIQYVAAQLQDRVFKDCVKFVRDLNDQDWVIYLATGKRSGRSGTTEDASFTERGDEDEPFDRLIDSVRLTISPPWAMDKSLPHTIVEQVRSRGETGLTNPDIYALTLGASFNRFLSALTRSMSSHGMQPSSLSHLQLKSEHIRSGKLAYYKFITFPPQRRETLAIEARSGEPPSGPTVYSIEGQFPLNPLAIISATSVMNLAEICSLGRTSGIKIPDNEQPARDLITTAKHTAESSVKMEGESTLTNVNANEQTRDVEQARGSSLCITLKLSSSVMRNTMQEGRELRISDGLHGATSREDTIERDLHTVSSECHSSSNQALQQDNEASSNGIGQGERANSTGGVDCHKLGRIQRRRRGRGHGHESKLASETRLVESTNNPTANLKSWKCEKCGGSWKNDLGLKYHIQKSRSSCNPSHQAIEKDSVRRKRKSTVFNSTEQGRKQKDEGGGDSTYDKRRAQTRPTPLMDEESPADISMDNRGEEQSLSEMNRTQATRAKIWVTVRSWRQAAMVQEDPVHRHLKIATNELLITSQKSRAHRVQNWNCHGDSPYLTTNLTEKIENRAHFAESEVDAMPQFSRPKLTEEAEESRLKEKPGQLALSSSFDATSKRLTATETFTPTSNAHELRRDQLCDMIGHMLDNTGYVLGGKPLIDAMQSAWIGTHDGGEVITAEDCRSALSHMLRQKNLVEHWHAFRNHKGTFTRCQIISWPNLDALSEDALRLVEYWRNSYHQEEHRANGSKRSNESQSQDLKMPPRYQREISSKIEILDAPVYAAQVALKRGMGTADVSAHREKRPRYSHQEACETLMSSSYWLSGGKGTGLTGSEKLSSQEVLHDKTILASERCQHTAPIFEAKSLISAPNPVFVKPNTYLVEHCPDWNAEKQMFHLSPYQEPDYKCNRAPHAPSSVAYSFTNTMTIFGYCGIWPSLESDRLTTLDQSLSLSGWMPDYKWFAWERIAQEMEEPCADDRQTFPRSVHSISRLADYLESCLAFELSRTAPFITARPGDAGPHNIFIRFFALPSDTSWVLYPHFAWPPDLQLTPSMVRYDSITLEDEPYSYSSDDWKTSLRQRDLHVTSKRKRNAGTNQLKFRQLNLKRVPLTTRSLTTLSQLKKNGDEQTTEIEEPHKVMAAIIAVRCLLGGADKAIDWGLLLRVLPNLSLNELRRFWTNSQKELSTYILNYTHVFQEKVIAAFDNDGIPMLDFDCPLAYDWTALLTWTARIPYLEGFQLPRRREDLDANFTLKDAPKQADDRQERYFNPQSSIFSRLEAITSQPGAVAIDDALKNAHYVHAFSEERVARSWIKSLCISGSESHSSEEIRTKLHGLATGDADHRSVLLRKVISQLLQERVICKPKVAAPEGGRYCLNDWYLSQLAKVAQTRKYDEAAVFKEKLDNAFRQQGFLMASNNPSDGETMALLNLSTFGRIALVPKNFPQVPSGLEPGNYESRKFSESDYYFDVKAVPTETYLLNDSINTLQAVSTREMPLRGPFGELPQWVNLLGKGNTQRWSEVLGAFCFILATRGTMTVPGICSALHPLLDEHEALVIEEWSRETGVLEKTTNLAGMILGEWWWLVVPWIRRK